MPPIPIAKSAYKRPDNPQIRLLNMSFESDPANQEDQSSLVTRPGLPTFGATNGSATRAVYRLAGAFSGYILAIAGSQVVAITPTGVAVEPFTGVAITGTDSATVAAIRTLGGGNALIAAGNVLYSVTGAVAVAAFPDNQPVISVDIIGSRFVASCGGQFSDRFYWSDLNSLIFQALSYATAETEPDALVCVKVVSDDLWLFGETSIEVWGQTGDVDLPFQRQNGRTFGIGCLTRASIAKLESTLFWVGGKERKVYMAAPNPQPISDPGVEAKLRLAVVTDINAFTCDVDGHAFYVLNMGAQGSMAYDLTTSTWSDWRTYGRTDLEARFAAPVGDGRYLTGSIDGRFLLVDPLTNQDSASKPIEREWTGSLDLSTTIRCDNVILDATVGSAADYPPDPKVALRYSDDRTRTWSDWDSVSLGHRGDFSQQVAWTRLGLMERPGRVFEWKCTENLPFMVRRAKFNERV